MATRNRALTLSVAVSAAAILLLSVGYWKPNPFSAAEPTRLLPREQRQTLEERGPAGQLHVRREVIQTSDGTTLNDGRLTVWYPDGAVRSEGTWWRGQKHGLFTHWHPNGQKAREVTYHYGRAQGLFQEWDEQGQLIKSQAWHDGTPQR